MSIPEAKCPLRKGKKRARKPDPYCWKCDKSKCENNHSICLHCEWQGTANKLNEKKKKCFNCGCLKFDLSEISEF